MQRKKSVWKRIGDKGYYIALAVCAAAVAVSGILFVKSLRPASKTAATQTDAHTSAVLDEHLLAGRPSRKKKRPSPPRRLSRPSRSSL